VGGNHVRELFQMWSNTRMVVLTAMCAALYAAILIPFKIVPLIPGITEFRPANAVPVVCSLLFGPAAAWGAAFGNVIGDFFGGLGPGDVFGFLGNLLYGLLPYTVWEALTDREPVPRGVGVSLALAAVIALAAMLCATVIGWGLNLLRFHAFTVLASIVLLNNLVVALALAPFLLAVLYPRVRRARLLYRDLLGPRAPVPRWRALAGVLLVAGGTIGAFVLGQLISTGRWQPPWAPWETPSRGIEVGVGLIPPLAVAIIGLALL
jgi:energy-coupling factor transport system substrate-specific component